MPLFRENEMPMLDAAPLKIRPLWKAARTDEPLAIVSGSTWVSCWLSPFRYGSREIWRDTTSQSRARRSAPSAVTRSRPRPQETVSRTPFSAWIRSFRGVPRILAAEAEDVTASVAAARKKTARFSGFPARPARRRNP
jgi:hypothetical protein